MRSLTRWIMWSYLASLSWTLFLPNFLRILSQVSESTTTDGNIDLCSTYVCLHRWHADGSIAPRSQMTRQDLEVSLARSKNTPSIWSSVFKRFSWNRSTIQLEASRWAEHRQTDRRTDRQTDRRTDRRTDRLVWQAGRQADRQRTDRQMGQIKHNWDKCTCFFS